MKKVGCAKCGGTMNKMAKGGSTTNKLNNPKGYAPAQKGGDNTKMGLYGVPNAGRTDSLGFKKGGSVKNLPKAQDGKTVKSGAQLKKEGLAQKAKGIALKNEGAALKADGKTLKAAGKILNKQAEARGTFSQGFKDSFNTLTSFGKAKFGASVNVQRGYPGKIRSANDQGYTAIGKREPARNKFAKGGATKKLVKAQTGGTPFQKYMKTPGAVASDTTMQTVSPSMEKLSGPGVWNAPKKPVAKSSKNQKALENAYDKTYGEGYRNETGQPAKGETMEQYKRRMGPMKKGGTVKKYAKGGSAKSFPDLNNDGKITKADILKGRGVIKKMGGSIKKK